MMFLEIPAIKQLNFLLSKSKMKRFLLLTLLALSFMVKTQAQEEKYISLFVYNFTKYFDWPKEAKSGDFLIQVLGHKSVYDELARVTVGKSVGSQKIVVEHITSPDHINPESQIFFLGHWQTRHLSIVKSKIASGSTLLVTEFEGLLAKGASINFIIREGSIKFEFHKTNAMNAGLKTDPRLVQLAYSVFE